VARSRPRVSGKNSCSDLDKPATRCFPTRRPDPHGTRAKSAARANWISASAAYVFYSPGLFAITPNVDFIQDLLAGTSEETSANPNTEYCDNWRASYHGHQRAASALPAPCNPVYPDCKTHRAGSPGQRASRTSPISLSRSCVVCGNNLVRKSGPSSCKRYSSAAPATPECASTLRHHHGH